VISVIVGPGDEAKTYLVHAKVLARSSHFFKACMTNDWLEREEKTIEMPDDDPTIVNLYIECCY
ncbi:hypothetical protein BDZ85DRAFT_176191, partial [Elsinoe ampelina]